MVARQVHILEAAGSSPAPAIMKLATFAQIVSDGINDAIVIRAGISSDFLVEEPSEAEPGRFVILVSCGNEFIITVEEVQ